MTTLPAIAISPEDNLARYLMEIRKFPLLEAEEEYMLARRWKDHHDLAAAHKLVTSHLRLVAKIAMGYRGYGLPVGELIAEGNIGMMQAVKKFEPEKGFRLSTYAIWWIKAAMQEYILRSWSLVKIGTSAAQKKLFFNLRKLRNRIAASDSGQLSPDEVSQIADELEVSEKDVEDMNMRLAGGDQSLNSVLRHDGDGREEWIDFLADEDTNQEVALLESNEDAHRRTMMEEAMGELNEREREILTQRRLEEPAKTLEELSQIYRVSRERIRQIEARALEKMQQFILRKTGNASS